MVNMQKEAKRDDLTHFSFRYSINITQLSACRTQEPHKIPFYECECSRSVKWSSESESTAWQISFASEN
jgi:hypothetical protein